MNSSIVWIIIALFLFYANTIFAFIKTIGIKINRNYLFKIVTRKEIDKKLLEIVAPYEEFLLRKDFILEYIVKREEIFIGSNLTLYTFYYYNKEKGVRAAIEIDPFKYSLQIVNIEYFTLFNDKTLCWTINGKKHFFPAIPDNFYLFDFYLPDWKMVYEKHLENVQKIGKKILSYPFDKKHLIEFDKYIYESLIQSYLKHGFIKPYKHYYKYTPSLKLLKYIKKAQNGYKKYKKILTAYTPKQKRETCKNTLLFQLKQSKNYKEFTPEKLILFLLSGIVFVALFLFLGNSLSYLLNLFLVLLFHELGHYFAMHFFGYKNKSIFFLPFGAVTIGEKENKKAYEEFIILLAGPLPGLLLGTAITILTTIYPDFFGSHTQSLKELGLLFIIINYLNLLPIYPLDGGKIVEILFLLRYPKAQFYFYVIGTLLTGLATIYFHDPILFIFLFAITLGLFQSYKISKLLAKSKRKEDIINLLCSDKDFIKSDLGSKVAIAQKALSIFQIKKASFLFTIFGTLLYLATFLPLFFFSSILFQSNKSTYHTTLNEIKIVTNFKKNIDSLSKLTTASKNLFQIDKAIKELESNFKKYNLTQPAPLQTTFTIKNYPCKIPHSVQKILQWHNGLNYLGNIYFYSDKEIRRIYQKKTIPNRYLLPIGIMYDYGLIYLNCKDNAIYLYTYKDKKKIFYNLKHLLTFWAKAYTNKAIVIKEKKLFFNQVKLNQIKKDLLSQQDKKDFEQTKNYILSFAQKYLHSKSIYIKTVILKEIKEYLSPSFVQILQLYAKDKNPKIAKEAQQILKTLKQEKE